MIEPICTISLDSTSKTKFHAVIPVERHRTKKNGKMSIKGRVITKPEARKAEKAMVDILSLMRNQLGTTLEGSLHAQFVFTFKDYYKKDGQRRKTLPDLSNLIELPQDALEKAGIIKNDTDIVSLDGSRRLPGSNNFLTITLSKVHHV